MTHRACFPGQLELGLASESGHLLVVEWHLNLLPVRHCMSKDRYAGMHHDGCHARSGCSLRGTVQSYTGGHAHTFTGAGTSC